MTEIPEQRSAEQKVDDIYLALKERFAKAWWDGYAAGVQDSQSEETTLNPWESP